MDSLSATTPVATGLSAPPQAKKSPSSKRRTAYAAKFPYINMHSMDAVSMIQTICQCYKGFTKHKVKDTIAACKAQAMTCHPADARFMEMMRNNSIKICPIKPTHITNLLTIFGLSIAGVRGKTVCCKPEQVEAELGRIHCLNRFVVMTANVILVNGIAFLTTLLWKLRLATFEQLPLRMATQLSNSLMKTVRLYACTGFVVRYIMMDQEFAKVEDACEMVISNTTAARKN
jgi:hypothetical protein